MFLWTLLILAGVWVIRGVDQGNITPLGEPTPTSTRTTTSYADEGDAQFTAGNLTASINAYQAALNIDPNNAQLWAKLARIQTYSSQLKTTDQERQTTVLQALDWINQAYTLAPDDSTVAAIRAFVLDWNATYATGDQAQAYLTQAQQEALRALQLDNTNTLALAYYAEILIDEQNLAQAEQYILQAVQRGPDLMDVHRVYAYLLESEGLYNQAIQEYEKAIQIDPNLTFLYLRAGANYRQLAFNSPIESQQEDLYNQSLDMFAKAAGINEQLGVQDPIPYLSIAKTYSQLGEYFAASLNIQKALSFRPNDPDIFGQLGVVYFKSRNYEGSIPALQCAVNGCDINTSCNARYGEDCDPAKGEVGNAVTGLPLSDNTIVYYYTYGSVLAALSRPQQNYCPQARQVFTQISNSGFGKDQTIQGIIQSGETICDSVEQPTAILPTATPVELGAPPPTLTLEPTATMMPTPTYSP